MSTFLHHIMAVGELGRIVISKARVYQYKKHRKHLFQHFTFAEVSNEAVKIFLYPLKGYNVNLHATLPYKITIQLQNTTGTIPLGAKHCDYPGAKWT